MFVVIESLDARSGGHEVKVHGIFNDKEKAMSYMKTEANKMCQDGLIEEGEDWFNIILGEDYIVFEIKEGQLL